MLTLRNCKKVFAHGFTLTTGSFELLAGETVGFLGANGSGKTTLFELLTGNSDATSGEILLGSERLLPDKPLLKRQIGYLPQTMHLPKWVTPREILFYAASLYQLPNARECVQAAIEYWDCVSYSRKPLVTCSFGMQKRVGLALATLHTPQCLVLDEPFSGLDLFHIRALENAIEERQKRGMTTLLSTHILPYVVSACQRVLILTEGRVWEIDDWKASSAEQKMARIEAHFFPKRS
jgi:ABC-2 type transport system ATP-binding protein